MVTSRKIYVEPACMVAAETGTWRIVYTIEAPALEPGATWELRKGYSSQLPFSWQASQPTEAGYVTVGGPPHTRFEVSVEQQVLRAVLREGTVRRGDQILITLGDRAAGSPGFTVWPVVHDPDFVLSVEPGTVMHKFSIPVKPGPAAKILVKGPSTVARGEDIPLLVRAVDAQGNTAADCADRVQFRAEAGLEVPHEVQLEHSLARVLARAAAESPRATRITVRETSAGTAYHSNPIEIAAQPEERIYWGDLHCHSNLAQALEPPEFLYEYAKEEEALDFICHTEHDEGKNKGKGHEWVSERWRDWKPPVNSVREYIEAIWEYRKQLVRKHYQPGKFVPFLGYEWASNIYGHMNVYYPTDDAPIFYPYSFWQEDFTPAELWRRLGDLEAFTVPHHPSHRIGTLYPGRFVSGWDWNFYDENRVPLAEIYSKHGNSEYFGCPRAIRDQVPEGCVQAALARGYKIGFVADTDTHASRPGSDLAGDLSFRQGGITAVFAPRLDRRSIFNALRKRRCYATSGQRIIVRFWVNDAFMGEEVRLDDPAAQKLVRFQVEGTARLASIAVVKNNRVVHEKSAKGDSLASEYLDTEATVGTDFYYLRIIQEDGEMAWASPVWVGG